MIERAFGLLRQLPALGESCAHKARSFPLHGFPYSLIYRLQGDTVRIITVAHHARAQRLSASVMKTQPQPLHAGRLLGVLNASRHQ